MDRRIWALVLTSLAIGTAAGFFLFTTYCGAKGVEANELGQPRNPEYCVSAPYAPALVYALLGVLASILVWQRVTWAVVALGSVMIAGGVVLIFSFGFVGILVGLLVLVAAFVMASGKRFQPTTGAELPTTGYATR